MQRQQRKSEKIVDPVKDQINALDAMTWNDKNLRVFLFGDYDFLLKLYGISRAQSFHTCLWCEASKEQTLKSSTEQPVLPERTLRSIKSDLRKYKRAGSKKKTAKAYNNAVLSPIWDIELTHVAPPYLHLLLGIVKKHHDLLERDCHCIDKQIAQSLAKEETPNLTGTNPEFRTSVQHFQRLRHQNRMHLMDNVTIFPLLSGPVTANLDAVQKQHKICTQAYHSRSFIGNHCNKYLKANVINDLTDSVLRKTFQLTDDNDIHTLANDVKDKCFTLNTLYTSVHQHLCHKDPVMETDVNDIEDSISMYMNFYRAHFSEVRIIPKQHILEAHRVQWIRRWGFGLAYDGEQGGEEMHATVSKLKRRAWGLKNDEDRFFSSETVITLTSKSHSPWQRKETPNLTGTNLLVLFRTSVQHFQSLRHQTTHTKDTARSI